jgi:hypothetical protein
MSLTTLTIDELFSEISDLSRDQGVTTKDVWDELVEEVIESHMSLGEIDLEEDTEGMKEILRTKWKHYKQESATEEDGVIEDEDEAKVAGDSSDEEEEETI